MRRNLTDTIRELPRTFAQILDPYRPELHYMRGPGPKWHAKRAGNTPTASPALRDAPPAHAKIAKAHA